jgi:hypothetical protein
MARSMAGVGGTTPERVRLKFDVGWIGLTIRGHQTNAERLALSFRLELVAPGNGVDSVIILPGLHANNGTSEVSKIVQGTSHRTEDTWDAFLAGHTGAHAALGPTASTAAQGVDTTPGSRNTHGASDIRSNTDAATVGQESCLSTG